MWHSAFVDLVLVSHVLSLVTSIHSVTANQRLPYILVCKSQNLPQNLARKVRGRLIPGSWNEEFFPAGKIRKFRSDVPRQRRCRDDDDALYNDDGEDYADLHSVQVLKNHLRFIHRSMILDHMQAQFLGGEATYSWATYTRVYCTSNKRPCLRHRGTVLVFIVVHVCQS